MEVIIVKSYQVSAYYDNVKIIREVFVDAENEEELKEKLENKDFEEEWEHEITYGGKLSKYDINEVEDID